MLAENRRQNDDYDWYYLETPVPYGIFTHTHIYIQGVEKVRNIYSISKTMHFIK